MPIYLDHAATTFCDPEVLSVLQQSLIAHQANPSSRHTAGVLANEALSAARRQLARAAGVDPEWVIFTSSGSESNALAIFGVLEGSRGKHAITTQIEHPAVLSSFEQLSRQGLELSTITAGASGVIDPDELLAALRPDTALVSVMQVNNELGTIQPVTALGRRLKERAPGVLFHVDAVQGFAFEALDLLGAGIDLLSLSGHKLHAPKGVGALLCKPKLKLTPRIPGSQEGGRRGGTESVAFAAAMALASERAASERQVLASRARALQARLIDGLSAKIPELTVNGAREKLSPLLVSLSFPGVKSEVLRNALEARGVIVSAGAACTSRKKDFSHVLRAIGHPQDGVRGSLRFSLSKETTAEEIEQTITETTAAFLALYRPATRRR